MALSGSITYLSLAALRIEGNDIHEDRRMALLEHVAHALGLDLDLFRRFATGLRNASAQVFEISRSAFVSRFHAACMRSHVGKKICAAFKPCYGYAVDFHIACCRFLLNDDLRWYDSAWCLVFLLCQPIALTIFTCLITLPDAFPRLAFGSFSFGGFFAAVTTALWVYYPFLALASENFILGPTAWEDIDCTDLGRRAVAKFGIHDHRSDQMRKLFWSFLMALIGMFVLDLHIVWSLSCIVLPIIAYCMRAVLCMEVAVMDNIDQRAELKSKLAAMRERVVGTMQLRRRVFEANRSLEAERAAHLRSVKTFQEFRDHIDDCIEQETVKAKRSNVELQSARVDLLRMQAQLNKSNHEANIRAIQTESQLHRTRFSLYMTNEALRLRLQEWLEANERVAQLERQATARESAHKVEVKTLQEEVEQLKNDTGKLMRQVQDINLEFRAETCLLKSRICEQNMKLAGRESTIRTHRLTISEQQAIVDTLKASHAEEVSDLEQQNTRIQDAFQAKCTELRNDFSASTRKQEYKIEMLERALKDQEYCCRKLNYALHVSQKSDKASSHLLAEYAKRVVDLKKKVRAQEEKLEQERAQTKAVETLWENATQEVMLVRALVRERDLLKVQDEKIRELEAKVEGYEPLNKGEVEEEEKKEGAVEELSESNSAPAAALSPEADDAAAAASLVEGDDISQGWEDGYLCEGETVSGDSEFEFSVDEEADDREEGEEEEEDDELAGEELNESHPASRPSREAEDAAAPAPVASPIEGEDISRDWQDGNLSDDSTGSDDSGYALSMDEISDLEL